jgi:hypothetical protein
MQAKLLEIDEHDSPVQCVQFADSYRWMATSSKNELILWNVDIQVNQNYASEADKENAGDSKNKRDENRFTVQVKYGHLT